MKKLEFEMSFLGRRGWGRKKLDKGHGSTQEKIRPLIRKVSYKTYSNKITIATANFKLVNNKIDEMLLTCMKK